MFRRSLFTVGLLLRHFDFTLEELYAGLEWGSETKMTVFESIYYFLDHESYDIQNATLQVKKLNSKIRQRNIFTIICRLWVSSVSATTT